MEVYIYNALFCFAVFLLFLGVAAVRYSKDKSYVGFVWVARFFIAMTMFGIISALNLAGRQGGGLLTLFVGSLLVIGTRLLAKKIGMLLIAPNAGAEKEKEEEQPTEPTHAVEVEREPERVEQNPTIETVEPARPRGQEKASFSWGSMFAGVGMATVVALCVLLAMLRVTGRQQQESTNIIARLEKLNNGWKDYLGWIDNSRMRADYINQVLSSVPDYMRSEKRDAAMRLVYLLQFDYSSEWPAAREKVVAAYGEEFAERMERSPGVVGGQKVLDELYSRDGDGEFGSYDRYMDSTGTSNLAGNGGVWRHFTGQLRPRLDREAREINRFFDGAIRIEKP